MGDSLVSSQSGSGQPDCGFGNDLVGQVARVVGGESETNVRTQALDCVNRVRSEINMHDWRFLKRTVTSTAFVAGQQTYTLPAAFKSPAFFHVIDTNGKPYRDLFYTDDMGFSHYVPQQNLVNVPFFYNLRNTFNDGLISFYPVPDAGVVSNYTWSGEYFTRVPTITDDATNELTSIPEEICNVLILGGQAYLLRERKPSSPVTAQAFLDFQRIKNLALVNDRRMTDDRGDRFRLPSRRSIVFANSNDYYGRFG